MDLPPRAAGPCPWSLEPQSNWCHRWPCASSPSASARKSWTRSRAALRPRVGGAAASSSSSREAASRAAGQIESYAGDLPADVRGGSLVVGVPSTLLDDLRPGRPHRPLRGDLCAVYLADPGARPTRGLLAGARRHLAKGGRRRQGLAVAAVAPVCDLILQGAPQPGAASTLVSPSERRIGAKATR